MEQVLVQDQASILVVDDNHLIVNVLKGLLTSQNYHVYTCHNGAEAREILDSKCIDVIVCDVMMPKMDGYQLHYAVRLDPKLSYIPFVFLTALGDEGDILRGKSEGADDYITKPFDPQSLLATIKGKVKRSKTLKQIAEVRFETYRKKVIHTLSHEFRTPLVAINTGTEILLGENRIIDEEKAKNLLLAIQRGGQRLEKLVSDFMLLQQIELGIAKRMYEQFGRASDLSELVKKFVSFRQEMYESAGFELQVIDRAGPAIVFVYEEHFLDILERFLSNAMKFSGNERKLELCFCKLDHEVAVEMRDRGIGMDIGRVAEATDIFGQIDREKLEQQGGGLGLAIANRYAAINNGRLEFENRTKGGSVVSLILPIHTRDKFSGGQWQSDEKGST